MKGFDVTGLLNETVEVWLDYSDDVRVCLRHVSREQQAAILKKATVISWGKDHQREQYIDNMKYGELLGQAAVADWQGLMANGGGLACTLENIALLMRKWSDFAKFVADTCSDLERLVAADRESVRKNSVNTSLPEVTIPLSPVIPAVMPSPSTV